MRLIVPLIIQLLPYTYSDTLCNSFVRLRITSSNFLACSTDVIHNLKGIISPVTIAGNEITGNWNMYQFPMDHVPDLKTYSNQYKKDQPVIYEDSFTLSKTGDTFLDMSKWGKGIVFVNGHNLGRYWNVGPQQTLYLPGCWLKKGANKINVFEQINSEQQKEIRGVKTPVLDELKK